MRIPRVYLNTTLRENADIELDFSASHYLLKVLRMEAGRALSVFDGSGGEYHATIISATKNNAVIRTGEFSSDDRVSPLATTLAIGVSRGERMDWVLQKATELGVTKIVPLFSERTEVKLSGERLQKKHAHWQKLIASACEQCQRNRLPELQTACDFKDYIRAENAKIKFVLHHRSNINLDAQPNPGEAALLIGPEGGLSQDEIGQAAKLGFQALSLGPRVLRTETAPIAALAILQHLWGDL